MEKVPIVVKTRLMLFDDLCMLVFIVFIIYHFCYQ